MFNVLIAIVLLSLLVALIFHNKSLTPSNSRWVFFHHMKVLRRGMTATEVRQMLGEPSRVVDGESVPPAGLTIFEYGNMSGCSFPTLGRIVFDSQGRIIEIKGNEGLPPDPKVIDEDELRKLMCLVNDAPDTNGRTFDPRRFIQIANALQHQGKEKTLASVRECLRVGWPNCDQLAVLLNFVFEMPDGRCIPASRLGSHWNPPKLPERFPHFPVVVVDDIPFLLPFGIQTQGYEFPPDLEFLEQECRIRERKLSPGNPFSAFAVVSRRLDGPHSIVEDKAVANGGKQDTLGQILRLVRTVYEPPFDFTEWRFKHVAEIDQLCVQLEMDFLKTGARWDAQTECYVTGQANPRAATLRPSLNATTQADEDQRTSR